MELLYRSPNFENVENIELYRKGGFHPVGIGDTFKDGRYRVLHKLGHGGFSTVWLARDELRDRLVSLKILTSSASRHPKELEMLRLLENSAQGNPWHNNFITVLDNFSIEGPNGRHHCHVTQPGGPSIRTLLESPGEVEGTNRLRAPLARHLARQLASAITFMHDAGIVHGGELLVLDEGA